MNYFKLLEEALGDIGEDYKKKVQRDQLAYLSINSKPEGMFRDWLAWRLYRDLKQNDLVVLREWTGKRKGRTAIDVAIVDREARPQALIQLKVKSSFGLTNAKSIKHVAQLDMKKCRTIGGTDVKRYYVLLAPHLNKQWTPKNEAFRQAVTYNWEKNLLRASPQQIKNNALEITKAAFRSAIRFTGSNLGREIPAGNAFDAHVSILYWLCEY